MRSPTLLCLVVTLCGSGDSQMKGLTMVASFQQLPVIMTRSPSALSSQKFWNAYDCQLYGVNVKNMCDSDALSRCPSRVNPVKSSEQISRRKIFNDATTLVAGTFAMMAMPDPSNAASSTPSAAELKKLQLGHSRVQYLLTNWDKLTQTCNNRAMSSTEQKQVIRTEGGGGGDGGFCEKNPLIVQEYLGYKSTDDPLFKADKLMLKAAPLLDEFDDVDVGDYVDLVERFREKADMTSLMAYTSSWGEANPNGGKEVVDEYLERTKEDVVETEQLLRKVLGYLKLDVLPPSQKKA